jgi:hypothetical protein
MLLRGTVVKCHTDSFRYFGSDDRLERGNGVFEL